MNGFQVWPLCRLGGWGVWTLSKSREKEDLPPLSWSNPPHLFPHTLQSGLSLPLWPHVLHLPLLAKTMGSTSPAQAGHLLLVSVNSSYHPSSRCSTSLCLFKPHLSWKLTFYLSMSLPPALFPATHFISGKCSYWWFFPDYKTPEGQVQDAKHHCTQGSS